MRAKGAKLRIRGWHAEAHSHSMSVEGLYEMCNTLKPTSGN